MRKRIPRRDAEEDETIVLGDGRILQDGETLHVPLFLMDSWQREMLGHFGCASRVTDGNRRAGLALNRPGFRLIDSSDAANARTEVERALLDYEATVTSAWRDGNSEILASSLGCEEPTHDDPNGGRAAYVAWLRDAWRRP